MSASVEVENRAYLSRATCGWRLSGLALDQVWNYWRDVHSPAISRRAGIFIYRHYRWDPVRPEVLGPLSGVETAAPEDAQIQWLSDILYANETDLEAFYHSPERAEVTSKILGDIEMIVDKSTTYVTAAENMVTCLDETGDPVPQGTPSSPHYGLFLRQGEVTDDVFRSRVRDLAHALAAADGVVRSRLNLFDRPDMEADRKAGYPVKTHPADLQYQAWLDVVATSEGSLREAVQTSKELFAGPVSTVHAYPVSAVYTFVWDGVPTLVGLRGFPAYEAICALGAGHATDHGLLEWMYGPVVDGHRPSEAGGVEA